MFKHCIHFRGQTALGEFLDRLRATFAAHFDVLQVFLPVSLDFLLCHLLNLGHFDIKVFLEGLVFDSRMIDRRDGPGLLLLCQPMKIRWHRVSARAKMRTKVVNIRERVIVFVFFGPIFILIFCVKSITQLRSDGILSMMSGGSRTWNLEERRLFSICSNRKGGIFALTATPSALTTLLVLEVATVDTVVVPTSLARSFCTSTIYMSKGSISGSSGACSGCSAS